MDQKYFERELNKYRAVRSKDWIGSKSKARKYNKYSDKTEYIEEEKLIEQKEKEIVKDKRIEVSENEKTFYFELSNYLKRQGVESQQDIKKFLVTFLKIHKKIVESKKAADKN